MTIFLETELVNESTNFSSNQIAHAPNSILSKKNISDFFVDLFILG